MLVCRQRACPSCLQPVGSRTALHISTAMKHHASAVVIAFIVAGSSGGTASASNNLPYVFTPSGIGADDSAALFNALMEHRWVQINGSDIQINETIELKDALCRPLDHLIVEPAPGIPRVTIHTTITRNPDVPTDPRRMPFDFDGTFLPGSYMLSPSSVGATTIVIHNPTLLPIAAIPATTCNPASSTGLPFTLGDSVYINDTNNYLLNGTLIPADGSAELRQILAMSNNGNATVLTLDRPLNRPHSAGTIASHCQVIQFVTFRHLRFTSEYNPASSNNPLPRGGIHLHNAYRALMEAITSTRWAGSTLVLLDSGGRENIIRDSYATGVRVPSVNAWGIAMEGQELSLIVNSGATDYTEGIVINYSYNTIAYNSNVHNIIATSLDVHHDWQGNPSIDSGFVGGTVSGGYLGVYIGRKCLNCVADVAISAVKRGVRIGLGATNTQVLGSVSRYLTAGVAFEEIDAPGQPSDGAITSSGTYINALLDCDSNGRLAFIKGSILAPGPTSGSTTYYSTGPLFSVCP